MIKNGLSNWYILVMIFAISFISVFSYASATCSVNVIGSPIDFLSKMEGETTGEDTLLISNVGTETATGTVSATDWADTATSTKRMDGEQTRASTSSGSYSSKTSVIPSFTLVNPLKGDNNQLTFWQVLVSLDVEDKFFTGLITQTVTLTFSCT